MKTTRKLVKVLIFIVCTSMLVGFDFPTIKIEKTKAPVYTQYDDVLKLFDTSENSHGDSRASYYVHQYFKPQALMGSRTIQDIQSIPSFVVTDGQYLYQIHKQQLFIYELTKGGQLSIIRKLPLDETLEYSSLMLADGYILVIGTANVNKQLFTKIMTYRLEERTNPVFEKVYELQGDFFDGRIIQNRAIITTWQMVNADKLKDRLANGAKDADDFAFQPHFKISNQYEKISLKDISVMAHQPAQEYINAMVFTFNDKTIDPAVQSFVAAAGITYFEFSDSGFTYLELPNGYYSSPATAVESFLYRVVLDGNRLNTLPVLSLNTKSTDNGVSIMFEEFEGNLALVIANPAKLGNSDKLSIQFVLYDKKMKKIAGTNFTTKFEGEGLKCIYIDKNNLYIRYNGRLEQFAAIEGYKTSKPKIVDTATFYSSTNSSEELLPYFDDMFLRRSGGHPAGQNRREYNGVLVTSLIRRDGEAVHTNNNEDFEFTWYGSDDFKSKNDRLDQKHQLYAAAISADDSENCIFMLNSIDLKRGISHKHIHYIPTIDVNAPNYDALYDDKVARTIQQMLVIDDTLVCCGPGYVYALDLNQYKSLLFSEPVNENYTTLANGKEFAFDQVLKLE